VGTDTSARPHELVERLAAPRGFVASRTPGLPPFEGSSRLGPLPDLAAACVTPKIAASSRWRARRKASPQAFSDRRGYSSHMPLAPNTCIRSAALLWFASWTALLLPQEYGMRNRQIVDSAMIVNQAKCTSARESGVA